MGAFYQCPRDFKSKIRIEECKRGEESGQSLTFKLIPSISILAEMGTHLDKSIINFLSNYRVDTFFNKKVAVQKELSL